MLLEVALFWAICAIVFGSWSIPTDAQGFYFYTGLLGLILGARIATPFFQRPADVVAYALPALVSVLLAPVRASHMMYVHELQLGLIVLYGVVLASAFLAIAFKDATSRRTLAAAALLKAFAEKGGTPLAIFGPLTFFALYAFHYGNERDFLLLSLAAICLVLLSPVETALLAIRRARARIADISLASARGEIAGLQLPGVILVRGGGAFPLHGQRMAARDPYCASGQLVALDVVGRDEGLLLRALVVPGERLPQTAALLNDLPEGYVLIEPLGGDFPTLNGKAVDCLRGVVATESTVSKLHFEVTKAEGLRVGKLLSVQVGNEEVLYQIIDGVTKEEIVQQKNTFGFVRAVAKQVGIWEPVAGGFRPCHWVPTLNSPVFLEEAPPELPDADAIGYFPESNFAVKIRDLDSLVTHNTAVLGVLGVGKSTLAFVLIEKLLRAGTKVLVLDITGQYKVELGEFLTDRQRVFEERITAAADEGSTEWHEDPALGGSISNFQSSLREGLVEFMRPGCPDRLRIVDPMKLSVTKQLYEPKNVNLGGNNWQRFAQLYALSPVEITRIVSEAALGSVSAQFSPVAKLCLVYEEAHSLIPEWSSIVADGDKTSVAGTARAILQGRKHGLGCLVVSQRTANVTKTVLNQCSTVFAMRSFDDTSKSFLANYIGTEYSDVLPDLADRQAVVFGRASSCVNPVLMQVVERAPRQQ